MFQVRENEISLRKWSGGTLHLRTLEGILRGADVATEQKRSLTVSKRPHPSGMAKISLCWCVLGKRILVTKILRRF